MNELARAVGVLYVKFIAEHRMAEVLPTMLARHDWEQSP